MHESMIDKLSRFTPNGSGLDRDTLLIAAGRASAPRRRCWATLAGILAAAEVLTLVCLWPRALVPGTPMATAPPAPSVLVPSRSSFADAANGPFVAERVLTAKDGQLPPPILVEKLIAPDPPLQALAAHSAVDLP
ncbi:MAG TPA: hypothetical protein VFA18_07695 [Gemmataceae bacterium]|nr:hypothetical protein [Gemmataceae bacterium]